MFDCEDGQRQEENKVVHIRNKTKIQGWPSGRVEVFYTKLQVQTLIILHNSGRVIEGVIEKKERTWRLKREEEHTREDIWVWGVGDGKKCKMRYWRGSIKTTWLVFLLTMSSNWGAPIPWLVQFIEHFSITTYDRPFWFFLPWETYHDDVVDCATFLHSLICEWSW